MHDWEDSSHVALSSSPTNVFGQGSDKGDIEYECECLVQDARHFSHCTLKLAGKIKCREAEAQIVQSMHEVYDKIVKVADEAIRHFNAIGFHRHLRQRYRLPKQEAILV